MDWLHPHFHSQVKHWFGFPYQIDFQELPWKQGEMGWRGRRNAQRDHRVSHWFDFRDEENKNKWNEISRLLYFKSNKKYYRSAQKCREYWFNHLDPNLNKNPWSIDDDLRLVKELHTYGFKWSKLTQVIESTWGTDELSIWSRTEQNCCAKSMGLTMIKSRDVWKNWSGLKRSSMKKS